MSELHECIGDEVMRVLDDGMTGDEVARRILAAVRAKLLTPEAGSPVEAAGRELFESIVSEIDIKIDWSVTESPDAIVEIDHAEALAHKVITAALDAAFGTEGSDDDH